MSKSNKKIMFEKLTKAFDEMREDAYKEGYEAGQKSHLPDEDCDKSCSHENN